MTKKLLFGMSAFAMLFATSCQSDQDLGLNPNEEATISFNVDTPAIEKRSYSDGQTATVLQYAVYDAEGNELTDLTTTNAEIHGSATVTLKLTTGNTYSVIFWAAAPNAPYTVDLSNKTMSVDYTAAKSNDETRDAFYKYHTFTVTGAQTEKVELTRPFAQLNIGTNDYADSEKAGYVPTKSAVTVKNVYSKLNLETGAVEGETEVVFAENDINKNETFPEAGYEYLAMNYVLVGAEKELVDVEFTYTDGAKANTRTVGSVPVQRNYRTNIYGKILTSNVDVNVEINPDYNGDHSIYNVAVNGEWYFDLATAVAKAIELNLPVEFVQNVKLAEGETITVKAGEELTLNLNGFTLSGTDGNTKDNFYFIDNRGTLVVNGQGVIGLVAKNNRNWNASSVVIANNPGGNLKVQNGVLVEHYGGTDMAYGVDNLTNGKGTYAVTTIEGATVKSPYRAVRQFLNGIEATNELYVKAGSVLEGANKSIFFHDPSKNANTGKLVVEEGAQLKGNVYLFVTAGSTEWPVNVSIADAALFDGSEVTSGNVPAGYLVTKKDGNWVVIDGVVTVEDQDALKSAVTSATEDATIVLSEGSYTLPGMSDKNLTLVGSRDVVITISKPNLSGSNLTLTGVTVKGSGYATGVQHVNTVTYNDVKVIGAMCLYGEKVVFNNCEFELNNEYVWTYAANVTEFNECVFNTTGKAILVYNEQAAGNDVNVNGCTFNASAGAKAGAIANQNCAAIEIDNFQNSGVGAAHKVTTSGNTFASNFSGEWRIKNFVAGNPITVNSVEYTQIAIDGKLMTIDADKNVTVVE